LAITPHDILNLVQRLSIVIVALLVGAAAPARAWCEATCLATAHQESAKPHCPSHEPSPDGPSIAAADTADCPVIESARPVPTKPYLNHSIVTAASHLRTPAPSHLRTHAPSHIRASRFFERAVPLRI
jgi:hypothetical protein